jgi:cytochrome c oxidase cbb3-type subunit 3
MAEMSEEARDKEQETTAKPSDEELLMDHEYDGIQEYDNPLPRWWVWIFWGTFFFAVGYFVHYQVLGTGRGVIASYEDDVKSAGTGPAVALETEETLEKAFADPTQVAAGKDIFMMRCMACHGDKGQGVVGPNLTDNSWIHGKGTLIDIYTTAADGVAAKGMPEWRKQLSPQELRQVVAYVGTLRGKNEAGKPPEGTPIGGGAAPAATTDAAAGEATDAAAPADDAAPAADDAAAETTDAATTDAAPSEGEKVK